MLWVWCFEITFQNRAVTDYSSYCLQMKALQIQVNFLNASTKYVHIDAFQCHMPAILDSFWWLIRELRCSSVVFLFHDPNKAGWDSRSDGSGSMWTPRICMPTRGGQLSFGLLSTEEAKLLYLCRRLRQWGKWWMGIPNYYFQILLGTRRQMPSVDFATHLITTLSLLFRPVLSINLTYS